MSCNPLMTAPYRYNHKKGALDKFNLLLNDTEIFTQLKAINPANLCNPLAVERYFR